MKKKPSLENLFKYTDMYIVCRHQHAYTRHISIRRQKVHLINYLASFFRLFNSKAAETEVNVQLRLNCFVFV